MINIDQNKKFVNEVWDKSIIPALVDYIKIPNKSPAFDKDWKANGHMDKAVKLMTDWCQKNAIPGMKLEVIELENRTPVIFIEIPGQTDDTILLYGHLDKQPEMSGWDADLAPWKPVLKDGKLYGRGGADDGYAIFASFAAIKSIQAQKIPHARCVILIEACEESGSYDLPFYINALEKRIGEPSLIICLDSGCGNYDQLWLTTSLRGMTGGVLNIDVLKQGVHSGTGSGVVPSCFIILRQLLSRIESETDGKILLDDLFVIIPDERVSQVNQMADVIGHELHFGYPFCENVQPVSNDPAELILNRTWRPALSIVACEGLPNPNNAGNVTIPWLKVKLSMRLAPTTDANKAAELLKKTLERNPPFNAKITFDIKEAGSGWNAPKESSALNKIINTASKNYFGKESVRMGEGGSIPFMGMLGEKFPKAQFLITGVLGPNSNAHGPNEFLHIEMGKNLTSCVAEVIAEHSKL